MRSYKTLLILLVAFLLGCVDKVPVSNASHFDAATSFRVHCAVCHGERRYGGYAPPLIPTTLDRKQDDVLRNAILEGLPSTQMPAFAEKFSETEAHAMVAFLRQPVKEIYWSLADISASRVEEEAGVGSIGQEVKRKDLILVVERGTGSVSVLDGTSMRELDRYPVGRIHGGIKFDQGFHRALAATRDGTLVDYDLDRGAVRARIKVGVNTRNIAVSPNGNYIASANQLPQSLVVLDGGMRALAEFPLPGQPSAVFQVPGGNQFLLTLRDLPHLYFVHYPEMKLTQVQLPEPFEDFVFVPGSSRLIASSRKGSHLILYDYKSNQVVASLSTDGLPHLFSASFFNREGVLHVAFNHMGAPRLSIIDMERFEIAKEIALPGTGYFTRTHVGTPYLWIDSNTEAIALVEKDSLELIEQTLIPEASKKAMHVEFTADGKKALVSVWHVSGSVVVYDSESLEELERLPYAMPVGKYNAANKTRIFHWAELQAE